MSDEPPESAPPADARSSSAASDDTPLAARPAPRPAGAGAATAASPANLPLPAKLPSLPAIDAAIAADEVVATERRPASGDGASAEVQRFHAPAPASDASAAGVFGAGAAMRRRSRRTVKIPDDAVPQKGSDPPPSSASAVTRTSAVASPSAPITTPSPSPSYRPGAPPLQLIPPTPPVPTLVGRTTPTIPRPAPKASDPPAADARTSAPPVSTPPVSVPPPVSARSASAPAPALAAETFEMIQPMRIISIGSMSPVPPAPPPDEESEARISRPPLHASAEIDAVTAPPPVAASKPPKPPVVEEVEAIDFDDVHPESTPRAVKTDEVEPIVVDEGDAERISDFDVATTAEMAAVNVDGEAAKPKKPPPPPPPPKRQVSGEQPPLVDAPARAPSAAPVARPEIAPPPPAAAPPAVQTLDLSGKKRQKAWWEEIFSDDFIRTLERVEPKAIRKECDFIEDRLGLEKGAVVLDVACGAGMHAVELASRGYNVVGYDLSLAMLARAQDEAQERGQKINFLQGDMREMAFEEAFDGMYSWSTSFGYFDDEKNVNVLARIHRGLRQGGMFLLDVINRDYVCPRQPSLVWFEGEGCVCMDEMHVDSFTSRLRVKRTVMFEDGRSRECEYGIRLYALHELGKMLHETGFKVVEVTGHPAHPGVFFGAESPRIIVLAERA